jgi:hypothetical protein
MFCLDFQGTGHDRNRRFLNLEPQPRSDQSRRDVVRQPVAPRRAGCLNIELLQNWTDSALSPATMIPTARSRFAVSLESWLME